MWGLQHALGRSGYRVFNRSYPSRRHSISELAARLHAVVAEAANDLPPAGRIHFVTHSLGGILVRRYLEDHRLERLGHVVMLGPPNGGSEIVDHLGPRSLFQRIFGPAGTELGTGAHAVPPRLRPVDFSLGIIAGARSSPWHRAFFGGDNDGKVSVERARVEGMRDFLIVPRGHSFMMWSPRVIAQVQAFLARGAFDHP